VAWQRRNSAAPPNRDILAKGLNAIKVRGNMVELVFSERDEAAKVTMRSWAAGGSRALSRRLVIRCESRRETEDRAARRWHVTEIAAICAEKVCASAEVMYCVG
jgi:hypothetical protein